jgi:hypothetical protein
MNIKNLSILLKSAAIVLTLMLTVQHGKAQSCAKPFFCSRVAPGDTVEIGYIAFTDLNQPVIPHYYLRYEIVETGSIYSSNPTGNLSADVIFETNPTNGSESISYTSSVNESGVKSGNPWSMNGALQWVGHGSESPGDMDFWSNWQTIGDKSGILKTNTGVFLGSSSQGGVNEDLSDFRFSDGTTTHTYSSNVWYMKFESSEKSFTWLYTLSIPYTDALLAAGISAKATQYGNWTDPATSLAAGFSVGWDDYNYTYWGAGTNMQYRVAVPASEKGTVYRFEWFEVTRDKNGAIISRDKRTGSVVGTGDPVNPAVGGIFTVLVPSQPGTTTAEDLAPAKEYARQPPPAPRPPHSPTHSQPPTLLLPTAGAGGR